MSEEIVETSTVKESERQEALNALARYLLDPDGGLLIQGLANTYYEEIFDFAKEHKAELDEAYSQRRLTRNFSLPCPEIFQPMACYYADQHYVRSLIPASMSNLLASPIFWEYGEDDVWCQNLFREEAQIEEWLMRKLCGLKPDEKITETVILDSLERANVVTGEYNRAVAAERIKSRLAREDYSMYSLGRILFKTGAEDVNLPMIFDEVAAGELSEREARIFSAIKLEASYSLFSRKMRSIGLDPSSPSVGEAFKDVAVVGWLPKPDEAWPWAKELADDSLRILVEDLLPGSR